MGKADGPKGPQFSKQPFYLTAQQLQQELETDIDSGLSKVAAKQRHEKYGANQLDGGDGVPVWEVLFKQICNAMVLVLILAMALSYGFQDFIEGGVITAVIAINVIIGFVQEFKAEKTIDSLRSMSSPTAAVLRDGQIEHIASAEVVPGDIVELKTGDVVPADLRLFDTMNFETDEALLTGESLPVAKDPDVQFNEAEEPGVGDRINLAYSSSTVTKGRARGIVIATGMSTQIGSIAESLKGTKRDPSRSMSRRKHGALQPAKGFALRTYDAIGKLLGLTVGTPLQKKLAKLAYCLLACAIILAIIVFGVNKFNITHEVAIYAISLGIAIIPESLIAVLTITFAVGMKRMAQRRVIVRKLDALEALGGVTNICSDKTGTLTQGKMITRKIYLPGVGVYSIHRSGEAADPTSGYITKDGLPASKVDVEEERRKKEEQRDMERSAMGLKFADDKHPRRKEEPEVEEKHGDPNDGPPDGTKPDVEPELETFLYSTALCNLAKVRFDEKEKQWKATGDPTEIALQVFSHRFEYGRPALLEKGWKQLNEYPFDSDVKRMSVVFKNPDGTTKIFTKGAVERIVELCVNVGVGEHKQPMTEELKEQLQEQMLQFADQGLRVLAIAEKDGDTSVQDWADYPREKIEEGLTLLGLAGLYDPPRLETKNAVRECTEAGIKVHMLTGDHPGTARAIAREVGIIPRNFGTMKKDVADAMVKTAAEFDGMTDEEIDALPTLPFVIARCAPQTKVRMIEALHRRKLYCAMTGDGVNDSPSLKRADVGIAMGLGGSDVAKSASDIVLTDDNFSSIVNAVEEGRRMFDNIQKFILHLLVSNVGEVILLICGLAFKDKDGFSVFPLAPLEILWINMVTSGFPAFGLGLENATSDIMRRPPHDISRGVFTNEIICDMLIYGVIMGGCCLATFAIIIFGVGDGNLGSGCNATSSPQCDLVFRARGAVFAQLTWLILFSAWEFKSIRRSLFRLDPYQTEHRFPFFRDVYHNKFLFWAVVIGALSVFPVVYIPGLNTNVFKHKGIGWEWALSVAATPVFIIGVETWKFIKRYFGLFNDGVSDRVKKDEVLSLRQGFFTMAKTMTRTSTFSRANTGEKKSDGIQLGGVKRNDSGLANSSTERSADDARNMV